MSAGFIVVVAILAFALVTVALTLIACLVVLLAADIYLHRKYERTASVNVWGYRGPVVFPQGLTVTTINPLTGDDTNAMMIRSSIGAGRRPADARGAGRAGSVSGSFSGSCLHVGVCVLGKTQFE